MLHFFFGFSSPSGFVIRIQRKGNFPLSQKRNEEKKKRRRSGYIFSYVDNIFYIHYRKEKCEKKRKEKREEKKCI